MIWKGIEIARTTKGYRVLETSQPPTYYFPEKDVKLMYLDIRLDDYQTHCLWRVNVAVLSQCRSELPHQKPSWRCAAMRVASGPQAFVSATVLPRHWESCKLFPSAPRLPRPPSPPNPSPPREMPHIMTLWLVTSVAAWQRGSIRTRTQSWTLI